MFSLTEF